MPPPAFAAEPTLPCFWIHRLRCNRKNKSSDLSLEEGPGPPQRCRDQYFREIAEDGLLAEGRASFLGTSSMPEAATGSAQAEPHHVEILAALALALLLLRVDDQLGQTQRGLEGLSGGEVSERGSAGVEREDGVLEGAAAGTLGIGSAEGKSRGLHGQRSIEYYNQYRSHHSLILPSTDTARWHASPTHKWSQKCQVTQAARWARVFGMEEGRGRDVSFEDWRFFMKKTQDY